MRPAALFLLVLSALSTSPSIAAAQSTPTGTVTFFVDGTSFAGGVYVAAGDVNGDGVADVITGTRPGVAAGNVTVVDGRTGGMLASFYAFPGFTGGVTVAAGDIDGDGRADIITGAGVNGHVKVFSAASGGQLYSFYAFPGFTGGVAVGAAYVNRDAFADILVGASPGGQPHVKVFDGHTLAQLDSFIAYGQGFRGGVSVAASAPLAAADVSAAVVPEPATLSLLALGGAGLALAGARRGGRRAGARRAETH